MKMLLILLFLGLWNRSVGVIDWSNLEPEMCVYHKNYTLPVEDGNKPFEIFVRLAITDLYEISEARMEFGIQCFILEAWKDPLLKLDNIEIKEVQAVPLYIAECVWKPDIIFPNCKSARLYTVTIPQTVIKVIPGGYLYRYSRYHLTVNCQMDFLKYPMDTQRCFLNISLCNISSRSREADLKWMGTLGSDNSPNFMKKFSTVNLQSGAEPLKFSMLKPRVQTHFHEAVSGNQTILQVHFTFIRHLTASIVNTYIPSFLVVCLSMVSFWIDVTAVPGRVTLGVTALLTLATEIVHARSLIPPVDYMTAMDIWLFGCLLMVFMSLLEFTMAQSYTRKATRMKKVKSIPNSIHDSHVLPSRHVICASCAAVVKNRKEGGKHKRILHNQTVFPEINTHHLEEDDNLLDKWSRILFPLTLIMFVVCYWWYYLGECGGANM